MDIEEEGGKYCLHFLNRNNLTDGFSCVAQLYRQRGKEGVPRDSKFTGRKRKAVF